MPRQSLSSRLSRLASLFLLLAALPARAQFNAAYDKGYKPMLDYAGKLKDLVDSAEKREDYSAVKDLGAAYVDKLDTILSSLNDRARQFEDSDNASWVNATLNPIIADAKTAKDKAEKLRDKGDAKENCKSQAIDLQAALTDLGDEFKKAWKAHEDYRQRLDEQFKSALSNWRDATKDARRSVDELAKKAAETRERFNDLSSRAREAGKLYMAAQDQCDKARSDLANADNSKSPDDLKSLYETWTKSDDLVLRVSAALTEADKAAAEAQQTYTEAETAFQKASEEFVKHEVEFSDRYKIVLGFHKKAYELAKEYKPFSW